MESMKMAAHKQEPQAAVMRTENTGAQQTGSRHKVLEDSIFEVETVIGDFSNVSLTSNAEVTGDSSTPKVQLSKKARFQEPSEATRAGRRNHHEVLQDPQLDTDSVTNETPRDSATQGPQPERHAHFPPSIMTPPDFPPASQPRSFEWLEKVQSYHERSDELRARIAQLKERHGLSNPRSNIVDCSPHHIPEHVCSESVLNERLNLPVLKPSTSLVDSDEDTATSVSSIRY